MSTSIDLSFVKQFEREVHEAYQRQGSLLRATVRSKNNVKGASTTFQKVGKGVASTKARHGKITPMNVDHTPIECTLQDFFAGDYIDKLDEAKVNHDERMVIANAGAWGLGRKTDELLITAADASTTFVGDFTGAITRVLLVGAVEALDDNDVPDDGNRWGLLTPRQWSHALTVSEFASADFVGDDLPFMQRNRTRSWLGVNWMRHTGLPGKSTTTGTCFAYHKNALGHASGMDVTSDITWQGDRAAHFVNNMMSQGACLIDAEGVVEIRVNDTLAIPGS
ncbi:hypothetical protein HBA54_27160 [Pelagibius litoralis]|uniref:Uncharacterized protein n=1 Tax=Pelagibius litoralis TaxID=374515 RepID=A0A967F3F2_9PROT|nr:phage capsid protein [Pelagibius litoralis]NIA72277.1 hypothetical protein [Pelagibius litoralis]